jgi:hypothetical protein
MSSSNRNPLPVADKAPVAAKDPLVPMGTKINDSTKNLLENIKNTDVSIGKVITILVFTYIILMIAYMLSESYRVSMTYNELDKYSQALFINPNYLFKNKRQELPLNKFQIASAFRPYMGTNQLLEYTSEKLLLKTIKSGARAIYIDVFNDTLGEDAYPIVSNGYEKGNWKLTLNSITFDSVCRTLSKSVFTDGYVTNHRDPFFLMLNLKTNRNFKCLDRIQESIFKYLKPHLLSLKFSYQQTKISETPMKELMGKLVIITSGGYENSKLEELVNYSWDKDDFNKISYKSLAGEVEERDAIKLNIDEVRTFNKDEGMTLSVPDEDTFFTYNYNTTNFFSSKCHFIFMNYQKVDTYMETYFDTFKNSSFIEM